MTSPHVDTDVLIRLLTGDDPIKQAASAALFQQVQDGGLTLAAPDTVIADAVFVLSSRRLYNLPRPQITALLTALVRLPGFHVANRRLVLGALALYASTALDFGDAMIAASLRDSATSELYSYDRDFDHIPGIRRVEP